MLKAEQTAVEYNAQRELLLIREKELNFHVSSYSVFGTHTALLGGFALTALLGEMEGKHIAIEVIFQLSAVVCLGASLHCLLNSALASIYGSELALRGPKGSVVRAVDGLLREKRQAMVSLVIATVAFLLMGMSTAWLVMEIPAAIAANVLLAAGAVITYSFIARIRSRFQLTPDEEEGGNPAAQTSANPWSKSFDSHASHTAASEAVGSVEPGVTGQVQLEGYMTSKGRGRSLLSGETWRRNYFMLCGVWLCTYKTRDDARKNAKPGKSGPISLYGYTVVTEAGEETLTFRLQPVDQHDERKVWEFRCDTRDEYYQWVEALRAATTAA